MIFSIMNAARQTIIRICSYNKYHNCDRGEMKHRQTYLYEWAMSYLVEL